MIVGDTSDRARLALGRHLVKTNEHWRPFPNTLSLNMHTPTVGIAFLVISQCAVLSDGFATTPIKARIPAMLQGRR